MNDGLAPDRLHDGVQAAAVEYLQHVFARDRRRNLQSARHPGDIKWKNTQLPLPEMTGDVVVSEYHKDVVEPDRRAIQMSPRSQDRAA